jgi:hypothetical protein
VCVQCSPWFRHMALGRGRGVTPIIRRGKKTGASTSGREWPQVIDTPTPPRRRKMNSTNSAPGSSAKSIDELDPHAGKKKPKKGLSVSPKNRAIMQLEAEEFRANEAWGSFRSGHWVCLYAALHERVYGFYPMELETSSMFGKARIAAGRLLKGTFKDKPEMMADFMRWAWTREKGYEDWRRQNNRSGKRMGWQHQFSTGMVSDYRLDRTRKA